MIRRWTDIVTAVVIRINDVEQSIRITLTTELVCFVPIDEGNSDYQKYLQWVSNGGEPTYEDQDS